MDMLMRVRQWRLPASVFGGLVGARVAEPACTGTLLPGVERRFCVRKAIVVKQRDIRVTEGDISIYVR